MNTYNYISPNTMWSMYLFNQTDPKKGAELIDENIIRDIHQTASVGWAIYCPRC